jgi:hypothetical protein
LISRSFYCSGRLYLLKLAFLVQKLLRVPKNIGYQLDS